MQPNNTPKKPENSRDYNPRLNSTDGFISRRDYNPHDYSRDLTPKVNHRNINLSHPNPRTSVPDQDILARQPESAAAAQPLDFTPPPKNKKRLPRIPKFKVPNIHHRTNKALEAILIILLLSGASIGLFVWYRNQNNPQKVFLEAYRKNLSTSNYVSYTTSNGLYSRVGYDFINPKNPIIFSEQNITSSGAIFTAQGYGTSKETYIRYTKLPKAIQPPLSQAGINTYVKIRSDGVLPSGVPASIVKASDPRYRVIGPVLFSNLDKSKTNQLINYLRNNNVYKYSAKDISSTKLNNKKVIVYKTKLDITKIKLINQSLASMMGFTPADIEGAIKSLDNYKDAEVKIYISTDKRIVRMEAKGALVNLITTYSDFNKIATPMEPETKVLWQNFASVHYQMQAAAASSQPASIVDSSRKSRLSELHDQLVNYYNQTSSYPTIDNLNSSDWVNTNLIGFDPDLLRDPIGSSLVIQSSPTGSSLAYIASPENPSARCANTPENPCAHFRIISTLSDGKQYFRQDP